VSDIGTISGDARLAATTPFAASGDIALSGDGPLARARLDTRLSGTLAALELDARGTLSDAKLSARTTITPFERGAFQRATGTLADVDLAAFAESLPRTRLTLDRRRGRRR